VKFSGTLDQPRQLTVHDKTRNALVTAAYSQQELQASIVQAMESHKGQVDVQHPCCVTLSSFLDPLSDNSRACDDEEATASSEIVTKTLSLVLEALKTHHDAKLQ
jgi:hypothetical protein